MNSFGKFNPIMKIIANHYNETSNYLQYDVVNDEVNIASYTRPVVEIVFCDFVTIGFFYFILNNI